MVPVLCERVEGNRVRTTNVRADLHALFAVRQEGDFAEVLNGNGRIGRVVVVKVAGSDSVSRFYSETVCSSLL